MKLKPELILQEKIIKSACKAFEFENDVIAIILIGSLAKGGGDRISDADLMILTKNKFHNQVEKCYKKFEEDKDIVYCFDDLNEDEYYSKKYLFHDFTSAEIHCLDLSGDIKIHNPYLVLLDKENIVPSLTCDKPAPKHEDFPAYYYGDKGLIWDVFECVKWLSRGKNELAKHHIKKLAKEL